MMRQFRVLLLMYQMGMGGSERLVLELAKRLDKTRFSVSIAWFVGSEVLDAFRDLSVPLFRVGGSGRWDLRAMQRIKNVVEEGEFDIVVSQHFMPSAYAFWGCRISGRCSLVLVAHSSGRSRVCRRGGSS